MPDATYLLGALAAALVITVALRAIPFVVKGALKDSALLDDVGRWMPPGAIGILAVYCLTRIELTEAPYGIPELAGVAVTVGLHWWRRNVALSIVGGTAACLLMANWVLPA